MVSDVYVVYGMDGWDEWYLGEWGAMVCVSILRR